MAGGAFLAVVDSDKILSYLDFGVFFLSRPCCRVHGLLKTKKPKKWKNAQHPPLLDTVIFGGKLPGPVRPRAYWAGAGYEVKREVCGSGVSSLLGSRRQRRSLKGP